MTEPYVIWIDPGLMTGVASFDLAHPAFDSWQAEPDEVVRTLHERLAVADGRMQIGWEMYLSTGGPQHGTPKHSNEIIGRLKDFALIHGVELLKPQPSSARKLGSVVFLRRLGWYKPGQVHANDAASHALAYLMRERLLPDHLFKKALHSNP